MIKARIKVALNKRGAPSVNASKDKHYVAGQEVNIVDLVNGDVVDGIDVWYKLDNGSFVWSGGVEGTASINIDNRDLHDFKIIDFDWSTKSGFVPQEWRATKGKNVKIGILDSGVSSVHPNLKHITEDSNLLNNASKSTYTRLFPCEDKTGHGTECAGIIGAMAGIQKGINGISNQSDLYISKVDNEEWGRSTKYFISAMNHLIDKEIDIISISTEFGDYAQSKFDKDLKDLAEKVLDKGVVICVAARDNQHLLKDSHSRFPLFFFPNVIGIGCIDSQFFVNKQSPDYLEELDFIVPIIPMPTTTVDTEGRYSMRQGSSFSTPWTAGIIANYLASQRIENGPNYRASVAEIKKELSNISNNYLDFINVCNELKLINKPIHEKIT
jgi:subtilisin family serine protease